ncbi:amino acid adenylation domain-containing protein [Paraburkholderia caledonica]|uniref:Amino acid adenylation domain-containing protein n=1 Tax=Paraburkholderia caledonica TaxID=134536 RepID=A0AB73II95_9BURK|nr:amino acid adenylation domain-containing protein [Paraburkholderia caledonica]
MINHQVDSSSAQSCASPLAMFDEQVRRLPDAIALKEGERCVSYRELDARATMAARGLLAHGLARASTVVLFMPRGIDFVVTALAALKAATAYVPVDPTSPTQRLRRILARCRASFVVSSGDVSLPSIESPTHSLDELVVRGAEHAGDLPEPGRGDEIAYVLHTSGTTGEPNGVQITCRGLANYLAWAVRRYATNDEYDALWHTATTFDLSLTSFFAPLVAGGRVEIVPGAHPLEAMLHLLDANRAPCVVKITPTHARAIVDWFDARQRTNPAALVFVVGGETLFVRDAQGLRRVFPNCRVYNEYGPTEATVGCCVELFVEGGAHDSETVAIGKPIDGMTMYIVDERYAQVPVGTRGEIAIAGAGVMSGYLGDAQLNERKLVRLPWTDGPCYLTGDIGAVCPDGTFLYYGRADTQIKLNGYRIELTEIEAAANESTQVRQAAAVVQTVGAREVIALFVEPSVPGRDVEQALARDLARQLPEYMRPARIVTLQTLPTTEHDKIDRRALAQHQPERDAAPMRVETAPGDMIEETLAAVWRRVLQHELIGLDDNYFGLGGDSLRSIEITALAAERGLMFSIPELHQNPTIRGLARVVRGAAEPVTIESAESFYLVPEADRRALTDDVEDAYPLNLLQEGMIYHREFAEKSAVYHAICSYHVAMPVDVGAMREAVRALVARHPLLRTSFDLTRYSRPLQLVHRASEPEFGYVDLRDIEASTHQTYVDAWLEDEKKRGFEIEQYPLIRFMLHHFADDSCQISYSFHHEIVDGWSDALMVTELIERYMSNVTGEPFDLPPLRSNFRDSILLEQQALAEPRYRDFWNDKLRDVSVMRLPSFAASRADRGQREIVKFEVPVSVALSDALKRLARELAVPLKSVLLAAHMKVMSLLGGADDVMTYTVSNGRPEHRDSHAVIGLFVNSLAFRMKLTGGSWADLVTATLQTENELLAQRRYPMAELKRQHGSEPLSETLFFFNHYHVTDALRRWTSVKLLGLKVYAESTFPYCVNAYLTPFDKDLRVRIEYDQLRYDKAVMDTAGHFYLTVLTAMTRDPRASYHGEAFLPPWEVALTARLARPEPDSPSTAQAGPFEPIAQRIAAVARRMPRQTAVVSQRERITYAELDARADRLAERLRTQADARPGTYVAVLMERGIASIVATVAILKTGAAYVPLSVEQPAPRLAAALARTGRAVVCDDVGLRRIASHADGTLCPILYTDSPEEAGARAAVDMPVHAYDAAYVIFTSGSSGEPKATVVSQKNLDAATQARIAYYSLGAGDRCVLLSSPAFDSAVGVIFGALASGATLLAPDEDTMLDLPALVDFMRREGATMTLCTPSLLDTLLSTEGFGEIGVKQLISAGEALSPDTYARATALRGATVYNEYGPTEATVWASAWRGEPYRPMPSMPIGRPIATARLYLLDDRLHPVPTGTAGELYIGGDGVALGYLNAPAQTAPAYLPDPFADAAGARMYRTGDLVRRDLEGNLEFLSRRDRLVKLQGFRVELGEVEHLLAKHASVHRAIAAVREVHGARQLIAYVVRRAASQAVSAEQLKAFCKEHLPKYMVPAQFVFVDAFPLSNAGKVDLASLEQTSPSSSDAPDAYVAPQSALQAMLVDIWRTVLNVETVGIHDDFAKLGGESLAALRIAAKVRSTLGIDLPVRTLIASISSVAELANVLNAQSRRAATAVTVPEEHEIGEL